MTGCCSKSPLKIIFLRPPFSCPEDDQYDLRWFTPRCEVSLCGHATLASGVCDIEHAASRAPNGSIRDPVQRDFDG